MSDTDRIAQIVAALARLEAGQEDTRNQIRDLRTEFLAELGRTRADIMDKIEALTAETGRIRDDITVNIGGTDALRKANDNIRDDLRQMREQMAVIYRRMRQAEAEIRALKGEA